MPLIVLATNQQITDKPSLCLDLSRATADLLGKPESYVMAMIQDAQTLSFAGNDQPAAYVQLKSLGLTEDKTSDYSEKLCALISGLTNIPSERIYIEFSSPPRHFWGWDSRTFG